MAQQHIFLKILHQEGDTVARNFYLLAYDRDRYYLKDSAIAAPDGSIHFIVHESATRMYKITSPGFIRDMELIVASSEQEIRISGTKEELNQGQYNFYGSTENYCWQAFLNAQREFQQHSKDFLTAKYVLDKFDPHMITKYDRFDSAFNAAILQYDAELNRLSAEFKNTFCGSVLIKNAVLPSRYMSDRWKTEFDNDNAFWHVHYFDFLDLQDPRILNAPQLRNSLDAYLNNYTYPNRTGQQYFVDLLFAKPMAEEVRNFLMELYLQTFANLNDGAMVQYMLDKATDVCPADSASSLFSALRLLQPGSPAPDLNLPDLTGTRQVLSIQCKHQPYTLVVFYSPYCPHCVDFLEELAPVYTAHRDSLSVLTITDSQPAEVAQFNAQHQFTWITIAADTSSTAVKDAYRAYAVIGTPAVTLIDRNMKIITRFADMDTLRKLLLN